MRLIKKGSQKIILLLQKHHLTCLGVFAGIAIMVMTVAYPMLRPPHLRVSFLDVGQGDAILIQAPNGHELLIDSGRDQSVVEKVGAEKNFFDRTIDMVLATHSDADHIGGFPYLFDRYIIPVVIESEISSPTLIDRTFSQKVKDETSSQLMARSGERIMLDPKRNIVVDLLFPDQKPIGWETNEASIVLKVSYGTTSFLLTGDSPSEVEDFLVKEYGAQLHADVLKLGHHGSKTSSSEKFLETVKPSIAIVSAGLGNKYGHPTPETIERVESINAQVFETSQSGTIHCDSNGREVVCNGTK